MPPHTGKHVFGFDANPHLHRRSADPVQAREHMQQLANQNRLAEIDAIYRDRDAAMPCVPNGTHRAGLVDQCENGPAKHVAERVLVARHHQRRTGVLCLPDGA